MIVKEGLIFVSADVHSIMMEKFAQAGEGCTPTPFQPVTITYKVVVYAPAENSRTD